MRFLLTPLLVYLGVTIVVPILNGSGGEPGFIEHAITVMVVALSITVVAATIFTARRASAR